MDIKQIRKIEQIKAVQAKIRKHNEDKFYNMFDVEEIALISEYIKLYTNNGEKKFLADFFGVSDSCRIILDQLNNQFVPKFKVLKDDPFEILSKDELIKGRGLIMQHVRRDIDWLQRSRELEEYLESSIRGKEELWDKIISFFDDNDRSNEYYDEGRSPKFSIKGNKTIALSADLPYIRITLLSEDDYSDIDVMVLSRIKEDQTNETILKDKLAELEELDKWVDKKIENSIKYIKNHELDQKYLMRH